MRKVAIWKLALAATTALVASPTLAQESAVPDPAASEPALEDQFRDPPNSARPRVWWHWMNGNVTKDGIAKDFAWMKRVGIGGVQNFDANLQTPQIVDERLVYMTPAWKDAFRFAVTEADRLGLELAIAASPGWSETGGPWVPAEDGLKKLVWSETMVTGGKRFKGKLAAPPGETGPYATLGMAASIEELMTGTKGVHAKHQHYGEVMVLAVPDANAAKLVPVKVSDSTGSTFDAASLIDGNMAAGADVKRPDGGANPALLLDYGKPVTVRSASLYAPGTAMIFFGAVFEPRLESSIDGKTWRKVVDFQTGQVPVTVSFPAVTARHFRIEFLPRKGGGIQLGAAAPGLDMPDVAAGFTAAFAGRPVTVGDLKLSSEAMIDRAESKAGFAVAQDYYAFPVPADGAVGIDPPKVVNLTDRMAADGTLNWTAPALPNSGRWKVVRFGHSLLGTTNHPAPPEATGLEVDKFDGSAVRRYMEHYIGMYRDASGGLLGKRGVQAILTDSIEVGAANWTPKMVEQFKRLRGYDPVPFMPALTGMLIGTRADSDRFLFDYRRTLADLMASEHYGTVAKVAHENGLKVYGEALEDKRPSLGDDMAMRRHADVPMAAMWTHARQDGPKLTYLADIKGAASVAHIYGQNLVAAESMTASMNPWNYGPADLKRIIDLEFANGVNRPVVHTSVHVPTDTKWPGLSLFIFGQYFNRAESWAELARPWVDYLARNALMLQQGRNVADVGYFYGEEGPLTALYGDKRIADAPRIHAYDFVNFDALTSALTNEGSELVTPGGARYKALYLGGSSRKMTLAALKRIAALAEGGATVIGMKPEGSPALKDDPAEYAALTARLWPGAKAVRLGKGRVIASSDVEAALAGIKVQPQFTYSGAGEGSDIAFVQRHLSDGETFFLSNARDRTETVEARFRVIGKAPELWRAETGTSEPLSYRIDNGETVVPLTLGPDESVHVVFRKPAASDALAIKKLAPATLATLEGAWNVAFQPGRGAPASAVLPALVALDKHTDPAIRHFSGIATYTRDFVAPAAWRAGEPLWLDLGDAREVAEVIVNGKTAGHAWHAPYRIDIGSAARRGRNTLQIRVANLWVNRLIGDAQPGVQKLTYTAMPTYKADAPLRPSGLIGPVTLMGQGK